MARLTRADSTKALQHLLEPQLTDDKRERLLRAAFSVIGDNGYEATSVARIARAAGMAPGLVHYYFESKDALLVAVADWCSHMFDGALDSLPDFDDPRDYLRSRIESAGEIVALLPSWYVVRVALYGLAVRMPEMREELARIEAEARERVGAVVGAAVDRIGIEEAGFDVVGASGALLGAFDGIAQQALVDPAFDIGRAYRSLADAYMALVREAEGGPR